MRRAVRRKSFWPQRRREPLAVRRGGDAAQVLAGKDGQALPVYADAKSPRWSEKQNGGNDGDEV